LCRRSWFSSSRNDRRTPWRATPSWFSYRPRTPFLFLLPFSVANPNAFHSRDVSTLSRDDGSVSGGNRSTASYRQLQIVIWPRILPRQVPGQYLVGHDHERSGRRQRGRRLCVPYPTTQSRRSMCRTHYGLGSEAGQLPEVGLAVELGCILPHFECLIGHGRWRDCEVLSTSFRRHLSRYH